MGVSLREIAEELKASNKKVQLLYAFNGVGKTRLSREFKELIAPKNTEDEEQEDSKAKILYYNAFTEDLFYWDNDLANDADFKLKIQPNSFTNWIFNEQGQDINIISLFQHYTNNTLTPRFNQDFSEVTFSIFSGNDTSIENIKLSKGEEGNFIWCIFFAFLKQIIEVLNVAEPSERENEQFDQIKYIFIDDPVSSLDENHLMEQAVELAQLLNSSKSDIKFIITTHNPLFYNVLFNEFKQKKCERYFLKRLENGEYELQSQKNDSPFAYHLFLKEELEKAIESGQLKKYHFNFLRNILEKTSTFLGYDKWGQLLPTTRDGKINPYETRIINISSHSKHSGEEIAFLTEDDKRVLSYLVKYLNEEYHFSNIKNNIEEH